MRRRNDGDLRRKLTANLTIAEGTTIKAPDGKSLTKTVDGVETPVKAGTYKGKIVISVSQSRAGFAGSYRL